MCEQKIIQWNARISMNCFSILLLLENPLVDKGLGTSIVSEATKYLEPLLTIKYSIVFII